MITTSWRNGERNFVERASNRAAVVVSSKWNVEPEIPLPAPLTMAQVSAALPAPVQGMMGSWDLGSIFSPEPTPAPPQPPTFTAEHAIGYLSSLAPGLTESERCTQVQELLRGITTDENTLVAELLGEAAQEIVGIRQSLTSQEECFQREQSDDAICIQVLEERLARLRVKMKEREASQTQEHQALRTRLDEMMGVIVFFDSYRGFLRQQTQETCSNETPSFLREDAVRNLLKHNGRLAFV